jgi:type IV fimbrial biogenesis protein FimT
MTLRRRLTRGFTLVEIMVALAILSIMLAVGVPSMRSWLAASSAQTAAEFYAEGLKMARAEALKRNVVTRLTLSDNAVSGQQDWRVDACMPTPDVPCNDNAGSWSTPDAAATGSSVSDFRSVTRSASNLLSTSVMAVSRSPNGAVAVYFTPVGWVDTTIAPSLNRIQIAPAVGKENAFPTSAVVVTLAGVVTKCNPTVASHDSRGCPP